MPASPPLTTSASGRFYIVFRLLTSLSYLMSSLHPSASLHHFLSICFPFVYWEYFLLSWSPFILPTFFSRPFSFRSGRDTCKLPEEFLSNI